MQPSLKDAAIDLGEFSDMRSAEPALFNSIVDQFISDIPFHLALLEQGCRQKSAEVIRLQAHFFRGASSNFKALHFTEICGVIENRARAGDLAEMNSLLIIFSRELEGVHAALIAAKETLT